MLNKRGQGISISTIIIAIISLVVLVVLILIFTGYFGNFSRDITAKASCADDQRVPSFVASDDNCPFTQRRLGSFADVGAGQVCCWEVSTGEPEPDESNDQTAAGSAASDDSGYTPPESTFGLSTGEG